MSATDRCSARVYSERGLSHQCSRAAKRDGFCAIHHPDAKKARREKSDAAFRAKKAAWTERHAREAEQVRRADCYDDLLAALRAFISAVDDSPPTEMLRRISMACPAARAAIARAEGRA